MDLQQSKSWMAIQRYMIGIILLFFSLHLKHIFRIFLYDIQYKLTHSIKILGGLTLIQLSVTYAFFRI